MKISEIIEFWHVMHRKHGDVEIHQEEGDGRSTWSAPYNPTGLEKKKLWKGHPAPARYYLKKY